MGSSKNEKQISKKDNKTTKRTARLLPIMGIDLCACGPNHLMKCDGKCRDIHCDKKTGQIRCPECYRLTSREVKPVEHSRSKRKWQCDKQNLPPKRDHRSNFDDRNRYRDD